MRACNNISFRFFSFISHSLRKKLTTGLKAEVNQVVRKINQKRKDKSEGRFCSYINTVSFFQHYKNKKHFEIQNQIQTETSVENGLVNLPT